MIATVSQNKHLSGASLVAEHLEAINQLPANAFTAMRRQHLELVKEHHLRTIGYPVQLVSQRESDRFILRNGHQQEVLGTCEESAHMSFPGLSPFDLSDGAHGQGFISRPQQLDLEGHLNFVSVSVQGVMALTDDVSALHFREGDSVTIQVGPERPHLNTGEISQQGIDCRGQIHFSFQRQLYPGMER